MAWNMSKNTSSRGKLLGRSTIYGKDGEHATPYMTRYWIGRLRLHVFHRPDADEDCHDHPWGFYTFPFTSYVEEVATPFDMPVQYGVPEVFGSTPEFAAVPVSAYRMEKRWVRKLQVVKAFRLHYRSATHTHRVIGAYVNNGNNFVSFDPNKKIYTLVWREALSREWGFLKNRDGKWCWVHFKDYIMGTGKSAACE